MEEQAIDLPEMAKLDGWSAGVLMRTDEAQRIAKAYARAAVLAEREKQAALLAKCAQMAEWHLGDGDECGILAREVYAAIRKG
jgi:hypothetical protein